MTTEKELKTVSLEEIEKMRGGEEELKTLPPVEEVKEKKIVKKTTKPKIKEEEVEESSVFFKKGKEVDKRAEEAFASFEDIKNLKKEDKEEPVFTRKAVNKQVYQLTYYTSENAEITYFTEDKPRFIQEEGNHKIVFTNCFKKYTLEEAILKKRLIKVHYKGEERIKELPIDLRIGVVLKSVEEQNWMKLEREKAEKLFTESVLKAYREFSKQLESNSMEIEKL